MIRTLPILQVIGILIALLCISACNQDSATVNNNSDTTTTENGVATSTTPKAVASTIPISALTGETIHFDGSGSQDSDGVVLGYQWDFGDNTRSNSVAADHRYSTAGNYQWTLTVLDDDGNSSEPISGTITVTASAASTASNSVPQARFQTSQTNAQINTPFTIINTSTDSDGHITASQWFIDVPNQGYQPYSTDTNFVNTSNNVGIVKFMLIVTDDEGTKSPAVYGEYNVINSNASNHVNPEHSQKIFLIGNSITHGANQEGLAAMASSAGKNHQWARHLIYGSPLNHIWNNPYMGHTKDGNDSVEYGFYREALAQHSWDAISLQPFDSDYNTDLETSKKFIAHALNANPSAQVYIMAHYPVWKDWISHDAPNWESDWLGDTSINTSYSYFSALASALSQAFPAAKTVKLFPAGEVMYRLKQRIDRGEVSGYTNITDTYNDSVHLNSSGEYIFACVMYAMLYKENPTGLPYGSFNISQTFATLIQSLAWEVAQEHF